MNRFFETIRDTDSALDEAVAALRETHRQMSGILAAEQDSLRRGVA